MLIYAKSFDEKTSSLSSFQISKNYLPKTFTSKDMTHETRTRSQKSQKIILLATDKKKESRNTVARATVITKVITIMSDREFDLKIQDASMHA